MKLIYLDNNATTKVDENVVNSMLPYFSEKFGNPSSIYDLAHISHDAIQEARETIKDFMGAEVPNEIIFTSCGTESANMAIRGALAINKDKKHIVTTSVEHHCVLNLYKELEENGYEATYVGVNERGEINLDELKAAIRQDTALVSIMHANNETGAIFPIAKIAEIVKEINPETLVFSDCVQAAGKIKMNLKETKVDFASISGHKFHAPKGIGALYIKRRVKIPPFIIGGHQERMLRAGTENVPYIVAMAQAAKNCMENFDEKIAKITHLRDKLEHGILDNVYNAILNSNAKDRVPNTVNIGFQYVEGELILLYLNELGICASSGSACTTGDLEASHVLRAQNTPFTALHGSIRFSLSQYTTEEEIDFVVENLPKVINKIIEISPFQKELKELQNKKNN